MFQCFFTASHIPLQLFSDFTKVSRSPIIRSIRLLAVHATVVSRHLYITSWAHCARVCAVFYFYLPPRRFAVNAIIWLPRPKPKTGFGLSQNWKTGFTDGIRFWKPYFVWMVLYVSTASLKWTLCWIGNQCSFVKDGVMWSNFRFRKCKCVLYTLQSCKVSSRHSKE